MTDLAAFRGAFADLPRELLPELSLSRSAVRTDGALVVSPHTVQDHVKSLFEKLGVASRQELVARVFLEEYLPEVLVGTPLASTGRFEAGYPSASASTAA